MIRRIWNQARNSELAREGLLLFAALTVANLSNYAFHAVISRLLEPHEYGVLGALLAAFIVVSVPAGAVQAVVAKRVSVLRVSQPDSESAALISSLLRRALLAGSVCGAALAGAGPWIKSFFHLESVGPALLLALYVFISILTTIIRGALQGRRRFGWLAGITVGSTAVRFIGGFGFVTLGFGVSGAVAATVLAEVVLLICGLPPLRRFLWHAGSKAHLLGGMLRESQLAILAFTGYWAIVSLDTILVRHYFPSEVSGFYAAAGIAARAVLFLPGAIVMVAFPRFAESHGESVEARKTLFQALVGVGVLGLASAAFLSIFDSLVMRMMFGPEYVQGTRVLSLLGFAMALMGLTNVLIYFHLAANSKAILSVIPAVVIQVGAIVVAHQSMDQIALIVLFTSAGLTAFNLVAAYAHPSAPETQPEMSRELWRPAADDLDLTVVTPAFNPGPKFAGNIESLMGVLRDLDLRYELIAVSDGSTDGSNLTLSGLSAPEDFHLVHYDVNRGKGYALRLGLSKAQGKYVAFVDSDGDLNAAEIKNFVMLMKTYDADLVIGSKRHPLSQVSYPFARRVMSRTYHFIVRVLFGLRVSDTQTGLKLAKREVLAQVLPRMLEKRFAFDLELLVIARLLGFKRVFEAPVTLDFKFDSTVSSRTVVGMILDTLAIFYRRYILRYYHHAADTQHKQEQDEEQDEVPWTGVHEVR